MLVFVDVGLSPYAIDTNLIENIISEKTKIKKVNIADAIAT